MKTSKILESKVFRFFVNTTILLLFSFTEFIKILPNIKSNVGLKRLNTLLHFNNMQLNWLVLLLIIVNTLIEMLLIFNFLLVSFKINNLKITNLQASLFTVVIITISISSSLFIEDSNIYLKIVPDVLSFCIYVSIFTHNIKVQNKNINYKIILTMVFYFLIFVIINIVYKVMTSN